MSPAERSGGGRRYRRNVGVALFNSKGLVLVGRRRVQGVDPAAMPHRWQMPQGGVDANEDPEAAARRELYEETGVRSVELLAEAPDWFSYDFPPEVASQRKNSRYVGQTQLWFAYRFLGPDGEIDLSPPGQKPEFDAWRWIALAETPQLIVPFKRNVYEQVAKAFSRFAA